MGQELARKMKEIQILPFQHNIHNIGKFKMQDRNDNAAQYI
jgi:hypothetical protein